MEGAGALEGEGIRPATATASAASPPRFTCSGERRARGTAGRPRVESRQATSPRSSSSSRSRSSPSPTATAATGEAGAGHGGRRVRAAEDATPGPGGGPAREVGRRREEGATTARPAWRGRREPPPLVSSRPRLVLISAARERNGRQLLLPLCVVGDDDFCRGMHLLFMRGKPSLPLQHAPPLLESV